MQVKTDRNRQIVDITDKLEVKLQGNGLVNLFVRHTTCALTIADLDPGTDQDYLKAIEKMTPNERWGHPHDPAHFPDHLWSSVIGPSLTIPYKNGELQLGTWQSIVLVELDGPREREVVVTVVKSA